MINQQVLDYVRQQSTAGVAKESIKTALISQGWSEQDVTEAFTIIEKVPASQNSVQNTIWTKGIPKINIRCMAVSLILVFVPSLLVAISSPNLFSYWYAMLVVLGVFSIFLYLENFVFNKKFANTTSALDKWIWTLIVARNLIFLLNFIPLIQLLGLTAIMFVGWLIVLIYISLIIARLGELKKITP